MVPHPAVLLTGSGLFVRWSRCLFMHADHGTLQLCCVPRLSLMLSLAISSISQSQMSLLFRGSDMYVCYYSHYSNHWNAPCNGLPDQLYKLAIKQPLFKCVTCMLNFWPAMSFHGIWPKSTGYRALAKVVCVIKPCVNRRTSLHHFCNPATLTPS